MGGRVHAPLHGAGIGADPRGRPPPHCQPLYPALPPQWQPAAPTAPTTPQPPQGDARVEGTPIFLAALSLFEATLQVFTAALQGVIWLA